MFSKRFADEVKSGKTAVELTPLDVEQKARWVAERGYDVMLALAGLHGEAAKYAAAAQQSFETDIDQEDGLAVQSQVDFDAARAAEAKEAFEKALGRFNRAIARLEVCDPS